MKEQGKDVGDACPEIRDVDTSTFIALINGGDDVLKTSQVKSFVLIRIPHHA